MADSTVSWQWHSTVEGVIDCITPLTCPQLTISGQPTQHKETAKETARQ